MTKLRCEDKLIEKFRQHLRHCAEDPNIKRLVMTLELNNGNATKDYVELDFNYRYVDNASAV